MEDGSSSPALETTDSTPYLCLLSFLPPTRCPLHRYYVLSVSSVLITGQSGQGPLPGSLESSAEERHSNPPQPVYQASRGVHGQDAVGTPRYLTDPGSLQKAFQEEVMSELGPQR